MASRFLITRWGALALLVTVILAGCTVNVVDVDPKRAARDGNAFLKAMFVDHDYAAAARRGYPHSKVDEAAQVHSWATEVEGKLGPSRRVQAISAASAQPGVLGKRVVVFFRMEQERGNANVWLEMSGDADRGYRVGQVHWDSDSPSATPLGMAFQPPISM